jgi:hypothetical protein
MPRDYIPTNPRPNVFDQGYEAVAAILHARLAKRDGAFYCIVLASGTTFLRSTTERRQSPVDPETWIGTYSKQTPVNLIEDDLIERMRTIVAKATSNRIAA